MPSTPYLVYGTVTDEDSSNCSGIVTAHDTTTGERITATLSSGQYVLDLANLASGYTIGDSITVYIRNNGYISETTWTLSGDGGIAKNLSTNNQVTANNFRVKGWYVFKNVLTSGTFTMTMTDINNVSLTASDHTFSGWNDDIIENTGYPVVIIATPVIARKGVNLVNSQLDSDVNFMIEIYHVAIRNVKSLTDDIENQIWRAQECWTAIGLDGLEMSASDVDTMIDGNKKIHRITLNVNFMLQGVVSIP